MSYCVPSSIKYSRSTVLITTTLRLSAANCNKMSTDHQQILRSVFLHSVQSVQPKSLFSATQKCLQISNNTLHVNDVKSQHRISIAGKRCHLVGFGKAVLGMAVQIEQLFGVRLNSGILSVPFGTGQKFATDCNMHLRPDSVIEVHEGAVNNLPDEAAHATAMKILNFVQSLDENDVLLVAISGGGSALIPAPAPPITLDEKRKLIKALAAKEATIDDINTVRIAISLLKGGKLAAAASRAGHIISLIISDVSGDPLDIIASGPTVPYAANKTAGSVLRRYDLYDTLSSSIKTIIDRHEGANIVVPTVDNAVNVVIGNNTLAANTAVRDLQRKRFQTVCLSTEVEGNVEILSQCYVSLARAISCSAPSETLTALLMELDCYFHFHEEAIAQFKAVAASGSGGTICLVIGGEPTVRICGSGVGGRNQELAMRISQLLAMDETMDDVVFLAAGTDGIDGPTDAAGAIGCSAVYRDFKRQLITGQRTFDEYLADNDSYHFYKSLSAGKYHVITGHTGTNVMDLHLMIIPRRGTSY